MQHLIITHELNEWMSKLMPRIYEPKLNIIAFEIFIGENEEKIMDLFNLPIKQVKMLIVIEWF